MQKTLKLIAKCSFRESGGYKTQFAVLYSPKVKKCQKVGYETLYYLLLLGMGEALTIHMSYVGHVARWLVTTHAGLKKGQKTSIPLQNFEKT